MEFLAHTPTSRRNIFAICEIYNLNASRQKRFTF